MVLIGAGMGISFVSLTSASLADVDPEDAGAASGLVNVSQQLGGALGLAVLVTVFDAVHEPCPARSIRTSSARVHAQANAILVHGLDDVFLLGRPLQPGGVRHGVLGVRPARQPAEAVIVDVELKDGPSWFEREAG